MLRVPEAWAGRGRQRRVRGARRRQCGLWDCSENVAHSSGLFVALIVDVVGPGAETLLNRVELWGVDAVGRNLCQGDVACSAEAFCEESCVEACVVFLEELDEARIADCSGGSDRVDVEVVAWVAPGVEGAEFVANGVLEGEDGADVEAYGCVGAPVDSEIDAEWSSVWWGDGELGKRGACPFDGDVVVVRGEVLDEAIYCVGKPRGGLHDREQVNVVAGALCHPVFTDRARTSEGEVRVCEDLERACD